jgi:hypothetical protein
MDDCSVSISMLNYLREWLRHCRAALWGSPEIRGVAKRTVTPTPIDEDDELRLTDGATVVLSGAKKRWAAGRALYEFESGQYVFVEHVCGKVTSAATVDQEQALRFLTEIHEELPENLQQLSDRQRWRDQKPTVRGVSHWAVPVEHFWRTNESANKVVLPQLIDDILKTGVVLVQSARRPVLLNRKWEQEVKDFAWAIFGQYDIELDHWWGPKNEIAPATVDIFDLQWPDDSEELKATLVELRGLVGPTLTCITWRGLLGDPDQPSTDEIEAAHEALRQRAPQIEKLIVRLRQQLEEFMADDRVEQMRQKPDLKIPSQDAFLAFFLYRIVGRVQEDVALMVAEGTRRTCDQGTISRWVKQVEGWIAQNNPLPALSMEVMRRAFSVDPRKLDMGSRKDGRTPRQRLEGDDL